MPTVVGRIDDCEAFWREVVLPDFDDFEKSIDDLRLAFHCAITLFHLSDWIYVAYKNSIDTTFTFLDGAGVRRPVRDEKMFANALRDLCPDFELIQRNRKFSEAPEAERLRCPSVLTEPCREHKGSDDRLRYGRIRDRALRRHGARHARRASGTRP